MNVAIATCADLPPEFDDDERLVAALSERGASAEWTVWDDGNVDWDRFDRVVIRSPWDYTFKRDAFLGWAEGIGDERLRNSPGLLRWNSDKTYLADLAADGLPVVPTTYVAPGMDPPDLCGEIVVKPTISAGARDTGRFGSATHDEALGLIERITTSGRTAMVQPYVATVDERGETAMVFVAGEASHALRKRALLAPDRIAPVRVGSVGAAEVMYDPDLVRAAEATAAELELGSRVVASVARRFGTTPLFARVDVLADAGGAPMLLELEAIEPCLYLHECPATAERLADAIVAGR